MSWIIVLFVLGYLLIIAEHSIRVNKSAIALLLAVGMWGIFALASPEQFSHQGLMEHLGQISEIIFFLMGAMTIVELIDAHEGFSVLTGHITTSNKVKLLWLISFITFFLSAVLDNLTTSIVMVTLIRKLIAEKNVRRFFAGMIIIAANSGGAFSPIGDVTTIMLWVGGHVTAWNIIIKTFIPSVVSLLIPLIMLSPVMKGIVVKPHQKEISVQYKTAVWERNIVFYLGIGVLLFVPVFNLLTTLPPYLGILFGLGLLWVVTELMHKSKNDAYKPMVTVAGVIRRIDTPSMLFFLGILLSVAALESAGYLTLLASGLSKHIGNLYVINILIGVLSAVIDNVPLVAGAIGMYQAQFPVDHFFWEMLAYCAGTGGSILVIGSAAGVAVMGMEKLDFIWYLKRIAPWALTGYLAGAAAYWCLA